MPRSSIALMLLLIGCTESAANVTYVTVEEMNAADPRVPPDAVVSSAKLANVFLAACFESFPNFEEANLAIRREGFGLPDPVYGVSDHETLKLQAAASSVGISFNGHGRNYTQLSCSVSGFVTDPIQFDTNVLDVLNTALPFDASPIGARESTAGWSGSFDKNGRTFSINVHRQSSKVWGVGHFNSESACEGQPPCETWNEARIVIMTTEPE